MSTRLKGRRSQGYNGRDPRGSSLRKYRQKERRETRTTRARRSRTKLLEVRDTKKRVRRRLTNKKIVPYIRQGKRQNENINKKGARIRSARYLLNCATLVYCRAGLSLRWVKKEKRAPFRNRL